MWLSLSSRSGLHSVWNRYKHICWKVAQLKVCYQISDSSTVKSEDREGGFMAARVTFSHSYQTSNQEVSASGHFFGSLFWDIFWGKFGTAGHIFTLLSNQNQEVSVSPLYPSQTLRRLREVRPRVQISGVECEKCGAGQLVKCSPGWQWQVELAMAMAGGTGWNCTWAVRQRVSAWPSSPHLSRAQFLNVKELKTILYWKSRGPPGPEF